MLILSRRVGQAIRIGDSIRITVAAVDGQFVRLGLDAPPTFKILREELWNSVAGANKEATTAGDVARNFARLVRRAGDEEHAPRA